MKTGKDHLVSVGMFAVPMVTVLFAVQCAACWSPGGAIREAGVSETELPPGTTELLLSVGGEPAADTVVLEAVALRLQERLRQAKRLPAAGRLIWTYSGQGRIGISLDPALSGNEVDEVVRLVTGRVGDRPVSQLEIRQHPAVR